MPQPSTPRAMVRALAQGEPPRRPLLIPILFSLGARLENVPLRDFYANPTKITNALRQIWNVLQLDAITCYFDPLLEAEALGCRIIWTPDGSRVLAGPVYAGVENLRRALRLAEEIPDQGRIPIACEVLQRLKLMLKDGPALMTGVTGPLTLATQLMGEDPGEKGLPVELVEFAADVTAAATKAFLEAGAEVVLLVEGVGTRQSAEVWAAWHGALEPVVNLIKFYEALPVLLCDAPTESPGTIPALACVACRFPGSQATSDFAHQHTDNLGLALPTAWFTGQEQDENSFSAIKEMMGRDRPVFVTSAGDVPPGADIRHLTTMLGTMRTYFPEAA